MTDAVASLLSNVFPALGKKAIICIITKHG